MYDKCRGKAFEQTDYHYFTQLLQPEWTVTPSAPLEYISDSDYVEYDATATDGSRVIYVELKGREKKLDEKTLRDGCIIDKTKVDALEKLGNAAIVQFFYEDNRTFVWDIKDKDKWPLEYRLLRKNNTSTEKVWKWVYYMPFDEKNEREVDLSGWNEYFTTAYNTLKDTYE